MRMMQVIVLNGVVVGIVELGKTPEEPLRRLEEESEYKVEYYHLCTHVKEEEHDAECWRR
jgi:hypothetical protein